MERIYDYQPKNFKILTIETSMCFRLTDVYLIESFTAIHCEIDRDKIMFVLHTLCQRVNDKEHQILSQCYTIWGQDHHAYLHIATGTMQTLQQHALFMQGKIPLPYKIYLYINKIHLRFHKALNY